METIQEWSDFMKIASRWNFRSIAVKFMVGLVFAGMIGSSGQALARGNDDDRRVEKHKKYRYEQRDRGHNRGHYEQRRRASRTYRYYGHDTYRERVYPPPPVIFAPPPLPGIEIFFPPFIFHN